ATSVDAKCSFSRGGLVVSKLRHSLSNKSTWAATVLNAWMQVLGLIPKQRCILDSDAGSGPVQSLDPFWSGPGPGPRPD
ncbi:hypothetical protein OH76DRAFT_1341681, partial [Lentinus brumalis]